MASDEMLAQEVNRMAGRGVDVRGDSESVTFMRIFVWEVIHILLLTPLAKVSRVAMVMSFCEGKCLGLKVLGEAGPSNALTLGPGKPLECLR